MARSVVHWGGAGLQHFLLKEFMDPVDLSDVTQITIDAGETTVYSTAHDDGPIRWDISETRRGEVVALLPAAILDSTDLVTRLTTYSPTYPDGLVWPDLDIGQGDLEFIGAGGHYREQCQCCGRWFRADDLIRQIQIRRQTVGENYLPYSEYETGGWTCSTTSLGNVSMGKSTWRHKIHRTEGASMVDGAATFWGDGELVANSTIDISLWNRVLLSGNFGTHQATKEPFLDVELGFYNDYGGAETKYVLATREHIDGMKVWVSSTLSPFNPTHLTALRPYFKVTTADDQQAWWGLHFMVQKDVEKPGMTHIPTYGGAVIHTEEKKVLGRTVVCRDCWEPLAKQIDEYAPGFDDLQIVENEDQEL